MDDDDLTYWSEANALLRTHGKAALEHAAVQVRAFMHAGDDVQMLRWFEIHERVEEALCDSPEWPIAG